MLENYTLTQAEENEIRDKLDMREQWLARWARPGKLTDSAGAIKQIYHGTTSYQAADADGDLFYLFFILDGTETKLSIGTLKLTTRGIWRWKLNNAPEDTTDYDDYAATGADAYREIDVTGLTRVGANTLRIRVNGKNASSTGYRVTLYGASLH